MAATDKVSGVDGALTFAGGTTFVLTSFSIDVSSGVIDVTDSSSTTARHKITNGYYEWEGTAEGFLLDGTATPVVGGVAAECVFTAETGITWTGDALVSAKTISLTQSDESAATVSFTMTGTGALTEANS